MDASPDNQITDCFNSGRQSVQDLIAPLLKLAAQSSSLTVGYGAPQAGVRSEMIPYFHVCGTPAENEPLRVLVIGGWVGTEIITPYAIARLLVALESRLRLAAGIEITAYPVANLEAHRQTVFLTSKQQIDGMRCWENSQCGHVQVLERELARYDYDAIFLLRQNPRALDADVEAWLAEDEQKAALAEALKRYASTSPLFRWRANPIRPVYSRTFTPIPDRDRQPAEIIIGLPAALKAEEQAQETMALILSLSHAMRQARAEGVL
ncbi:MAG TPA: hypothetical protein VIT23_01385 [Terrimicrobiaceae bacterium]